MNITQGPLTSINKNILGPSSRRRSTLRRSDTIVAAIAHALCYGSAISFIVLIPAVRDARNHQTTPTGGA